MGNIDHQYSRCLCFEVSFTNGKIIFLHIEAFNSMIDRCIADAFCKINLLKHIAKTERSGFRIQFITLPRFETMMIALLSFLQLPKNFLQTSFANALFCFWCDLYFA